MGTGELNAVGNPAMAYYPSGVGGGGGGGGEKTPGALYVTETGISSGLMSRLARMQTLPVFYLFIQIKIKLQLTLPAFSVHVG